MALGDDINLFRQVEILNLLEPDALKLVVFSAEPRFFRPNENIVSRNEEIGGAYLLAQGAASMDDPHESTSRQRLLTPPSLLGELALAAPIQHKHAISAHESVKLFFISRPLFQRVLTEYPSSAAKVSNLVADRLGRIAQETSATLKRMQALLAPREALRSNEAAPHYQPVE